MERLVEYAGPADAGGPFARLMLNSPNNRNALSTALVGQLHQGLRDAAADPAVRVVVLGHIGGTFCAGTTLISRDTSWHLTYFLSVVSRLSLV